MDFPTGVIAIASIALLTYITVNLSAMIARNRTENFRDRIEAPTTHSQVASQELVVIRELGNTEEMMQRIMHDMEHQQQMTAIQGQPEQQMTVIQGQFEQQMTAILEHRHQQMLEMMEAITSLRRDIMPQVAPS